MEVETTVESITLPLNQIDALRSQISQIKEAATPITPNKAHFISMHLDNVISSIQHLFPIIRQEPTND